MQNVPLQTPKQKNAEIVFFHSLYPLIQKKSTLTAQIFWKKKDFGVQQK